MERWNDQSAKQRLLELYEFNKKEAFSSSFLTKTKNHSLRQWLYFAYGSPINFCTAHDLGYIMKDGREATKWTTETLIQVIKEAYQINNNQPVNDRWLNTNGFSVPLSIIKKKEKSLVEFAKKNGLEQYIQVKRKSYYSEQELRQIFEEAYQKAKEPLYEKWLLINGYAKYVYYVRRHYGSLNRFFSQMNMEHMFKKRINQHF